MKSGNNSRANACARMGNNDALPIEFARSGFDNSRADAYA